MNDEQFERDQLLRFSTRELVEYINHLLLITFGGSVEMVPTIFIHILTIDFFNKLLSLLLPSKNQLKNNTLSTNTLSTNVLRIIHLVLSQHINFIIKNND